jgi:hypothetical protein
MVPIFRFVVVSPVVICLLDCIYCNELNGWFAKHLQKFMYNCFFLKLDYTITACITDAHHEPYVSRVKYSKKNLKDKIDTNINKMHVVHE